MAGYQAIGIGASSGDHTGDSGRTGAQKLIAMLQELFGVATNSYVAVTLTAASTDDYDPWGADPPQDFRLDINLTTNDCILTSLARGRDGLRGTVRNIGSSGYVLTCPNGASTGTAANKFYGTGDATANQDGEIKLVYYASPNPRWYTG